MAHIIDAVVRLKDNFTGPMGKVIDSTAKSQRQLNRMSKDIQKTGKNLTRFGGNLTKTVTLPVVGMGAAAIKTVATFDDTMSQVKALTGETGAAFNKLRDQAKEMGMMTRFTASQAAEAQANLASAGFRTNEILAALPATLNLASAGGLDLALATEIAASTLRGFGLEASEMPRVADVMARAAADTNAQVEDMAEAMKFAAPVASSMKVSLEDTAAAIGVMANAGIKGSLAGTAFRGALTRLAKPSKQAADVMEMLGFNAFDTNGKMLPLPQMIANLQKSTEGLTDQQKNASIAAIFGQNALSGMLALVNAGPDQLDKFSKSFQNSEGAAAKMAATMEDNLAGSFRSLLSAGEAVLISFGDIAKGPIRELADKLTGLARSISKMSPEQQQMIVKFLAIAAAAGPAIMVVGKMTTGVGTAIKTFTTFAATVSKVGLIGAIATPGVIVVAIIAAIIAAGILLWKNWDKITAWFKKTFPELAANASKYGANIMSVVRLVGAILGGVFKAVVWALKTSWEVIKGILMVGVEYIVGIVGAMTQIFSGLIDFIVGVFTGNWSRAWQGIKDIFGGYFNGLVTAAKTPLNLVIELINGVIKGLNEIKLPDWVPGIGGYGINIPLIPKLAKGTLNWPGGIAQVHERGGEIIDLPRGTRVYPHDESVRMARKEGRGQTININFGDVIVREEADIQRIARAISQELKAAQLNYGGAR